MMISKRELELLKDEIVDKNYKIDEFYVELAHVKATLSILQKKNIYYMKTL